LIDFDLVLLALLVAFLFEQALVVLANYLNIFYE